MVTDRPSETFQISQRTVLGWVINHPEDAGLLFARVQLDDFDPPLIFVAQAIHALRLSRTRIDALSVTAELERRSKLALVGGAAFVNHLVEYGITQSGAEYAAGQMARVAQLRRLVMMGQRLAQAADNPDSDPLVLSKKVVERGQNMVDFIESTSEDVVISTVGELLDETEEDYDWVLPGLLERGDRLILTGLEGVGKSALFRQLTVAAASGMDPFTHTRIPPQRVLLIDGENGRKHVRRQIHSLVTAGRQHGTDPSSNLLVESIPSGLDLTQVEDEAWLLRRVTQLQPAMLAIGPLYRLHAKNPNDEEPARHVAAVLDRCREAANCALIVEAHSGHGMGGGTDRPVRPVGSSLWLRWPEFGYGLRPTENHNPPTHREVDVVSWRGDREERRWPSRLIGGGLLPWRESGFDAPRLSVVGETLDVPPDPRVKD